MRWWRRRPAPGSAPLVPVPDLMGLSAREAQDVALDGQLLAVVVGTPAVRGVVRRQQPSAGWQVPPRTAVRIWVTASGPPDPPATDDDDGGGGGGGGRGGFGPRLPWWPGPRVPSGAK
jgi:hypothetical protein